MNKPQPAAVKHAPAHMPRAEAEETSAEESLPHHARRLAGFRLRAMVRAILDPFIALLQRLRKRGGAAQGSDEEEEEDDSRPARDRQRKARPGGAHDKGGHEREGKDEGSVESEAPKPQHRVRAFLIYFSLVLAGGMLGGALAYELLAKLLERQAADNRRLETSVAKLTKSAASNQKKLEEAEAKRAEAVKQLAEAEKKQAEAEKKFQAAQTDVKAGAEKQKKFDEAAKLLEQIRGGDRPGSAPRPAPAGSGEGRQRPQKTGDCALAAGDVKGLKDCVKEFNR